MKAYERSDAISRSAVLENIYEMDISDCTDVEDIIYKAYAMIADAPACDVAPVVHARWIRDDLGNTRCSNCHTRLPFRHCYDDEDGYEWDDEIDETPWCMHCGVKMDGEADG